MLLKKTKENAKYWTECSGLRYTKLTTPTIPEIRTEELMAVSRNRIK